MQTIPARLFASVLTLLLLASCSGASDRCTSGPTCEVIDTSFGNNGFVTNQGAGNYHGEVGNPFILAQSDGKILEVTISTPNNSQFSTAVHRYNVNGSADLTYGTNGETLVDLPFAQGSLPTGAVLQSDGALVVSGFASGDDAMSYVFRLSPAGVFDTTFGTSGFAKIAYDTNHIPTEAMGLVYDSSSSAFYVTATNDQSLAFAVKLLQADGSYDASFASAGVLGISGSFSPSTIALNGPDILFGATYSAATLVIAFDKNTGDGDPSFGTNGAFVTLGANGGNGPDRINSLVVTDSQIYVCGYSKNLAGISEAVLYALHSDGTRNTAFANNGAFFDSHEGSEFNSVLPLGNYLLITGNYIATPTNTTGALAIALNATTGAVDASFATGGYFRFAPPTANGSAAFRNGVRGLDGKPFVLLDYGVIGLPAGNGNLALVKFLKPSSP